MGWTVFRILFREFQDSLDDDDDDDELMKTSPKKCRWWKRRQVNLHDCKQTWSKQANEQEEEEQPALNWTELSWTNAHPSNVYKNLYKYCSKFQHCLLSSSSVLYSVPIPWITNNSTMSIHYTSTFYIRATCKLGTLYI